MRISNYYFLFTGLFGMLLLNSCSLSDELDKLNSIKSVEATATINANMLNKTWFLKDLIPSEELELREEADGTYSLGFESPGNYKVGTAKFPIFSADPIEIPLAPLNLIQEYNNTPLNSYFVAPPQTTSFEIPKPDIKDVTLSEEAKVKIVKLKAGAKINLTLDLDTNSQSLITLTVPSLTKNGVLYEKTVGPVTGANTLTFTDDIDGYILNSDPKIVLTVQLKVKRTSTPVNGTIKASLNFDISDNNEYVHGYLGELKLPVEQVEVPISISDLFKGNSDGEMTIKEAVINLHMKRNGLDIPIDLDFSEGNFCYRKGDNTPKPISLIAVPSNDPDSYSLKVVDINVLNIEKIVLNPKVTLNKGITSGDNTVYDLSNIDYDINTNVPLDLTAKDLAFEEEIENPLYDLNLDDSEIEIINGSVLIKGIVDSEIPINSAIQLYHRNEKGDDSYLSPLFADPITVKSGTNQFQIFVSKQKFDEIKQYKYQVLQLALDGSGAIKSNQKIVIKVGVALKGTFKANLN